jgi:sulfite reductase (ferredoxin)
MACVALPTCGLAITESERALPGIIDQLEPELARLGLDSDRFIVRMTGCPNGCARPYNADVGLVGKAKDKYTVFLGGRLQGNRLNFIYKDLVPRDQIVATLVPVFAYFRQDRQPEESFGDFCDRKGQEDLAAWAEQYSEAKQ